MTGEELKKRRKEKKLSQQNVADLAGVLRGAVTNWENGGVITPSKVRFLEKLFTKDSETLKRMLKGEEVYALDKTSVIKYVLKNFDTLMDDENFRNKILVESYKIAIGITEGKNDWTDLTGG